MIRVAAGVTRRAQAGTTVGQPAIAIGIGAALLSAAIALTIPYRKNSATSDTTTRESLKTAA